MSRQLTEEEYRLKLIEKHGTDHYDYSNINFTKAVNKIQILCKKCNTIFIQKAGNHMSGQGCPTCYGKNKNTKEQLIGKIKIAHPNLTNIRYISGEGLKSIFSTTCKVCNIEFNKKALLLISKKHGCKVCSSINKSKLLRLNYEEFVERAVYKHGTAYDYTDTKIIMSSKKANIKCNTCNQIFYQEPHNHLRGSRCSHCFPSKGFSTKRFFKGIATVFYIIELPNNIYKFGITSKSVETRYLSEGNNYKIIYQTTFFDGTLAWELEKLVGKTFRDSLFKGSSPFNYTGVTECITVNPINKIQNLIHKVFNKETI